MNLQNLIESMRDQPLEADDNSSNAGTNNTPEKVIGRYALTKEELRVIKECNSESFYYRCLPLGLVFIGTTQMLTNRGILTPHKKYGALFKNIAAGVAAFLIGKASYQEVCRQKIMQLENSPMAEALKKGKWGPGIIQDIEQNQRLSDNSQNYDSDSSDSKQIQNDSKDASKQSVTYDELRKKHRQEYERKHITDKDDKQSYNYKQPSQRDSTSSSSTDTNQTEDFFKDFSTKKPKRNKYGDEIE